MSDPNDNKHTDAISDELQALTRRVDRLERTNRALKIVNLAALAVAVAIIRIPSIWALAPGVINALQYNLYSRTGTLLATLGTNTSGFPSLTFFDSTGKRLTQVGEADNGKNAGVFGFDNNALLPGKGVTRASFGISATGAGETEYDGNGITRLGTGISADSTASGVALYDAKSVVRAEITQDTNPKTNQNTPFYIGLNGTNGAGQAFLAQDTTLDNFIGLDDAKGNIRVELFQNAAPNSFGTTAGFAFWDINKTLRAGLSDSTDSVGLSFFDDKGCSSTQCPSMAFIGETLDDSSTTMGMEDTNGRFRTLIQRNAADEIGLTFFDPNGNDRVALGTIEKCPNCGCLITRDPSGNQRASMCAGAGGGAISQFAKDNGPVVGFFGEESTGGFLSLNSESGTPLFTAPGS